MHGRCVHPCSDGALPRGVRRRQVPRLAAADHPRYIAQRRLEVLGISDRLDDFDLLLRLRTGIGLDRRVPQEWAKSVHIPGFLYQVHDDILTLPDDVQAMYDNIPVAEKKLQWIEGTKARWDGYMEFQRRPEPMLAWFDSHIP